MIEEPEKTVWHLTKSPLGRAGIKKGLGIAQVLSLSVFVVSPWRFERQAYSSGGCRSIQLSYGPTGGGFPTALDMPCFAQLVNLISPGRQANSRPRNPLFIEDSRPFSFGLLRGVAQQGQIIPASVGGQIDMLKRIGEAGRHTGKVGGGNVVLDDLFVIRHTGRARCKDGIDARAAVHQIEGTARRDKVVAVVAAYQVAVARAHGDGIVAPAAGNNGAVTGAQKNSIVAVATLDGAVIGVGNVDGVVAPAARRPCCILSACRRLSRPRRRRRVPGRSPGHAGR